MEDSQKAKLRTILAEKNESKIAKNACDGTNRNRIQLRQVLSSFESKDPSKALLEHTARINALTERLKFQNLQTLDNLRHQKLDSISRAIQEQRQPDFTNKFMFAKKRI